MHRYRLTIARICLVLVFAAMGFVAVSVGLEVVFGGVFNLRLAVFAFIVAVVLAMIRAVVLRQPAMVRSRLTAPKWLEPWFGAPSIPELQGFPPGQRQAIWDAAEREVWSFPIRLLVSVVSVPIFFWLIFYMAPKVISPLIPGGHRRLTTMTVALLLGGGYALLELFLIRRRIHGRILLKLPHACPGCGYDLTANASGVCPECGREIARDGADRPERE